MENISNNVYTFKLISCVTNIIPILKSRLPKSALILNMATMYPSFTNEMTFYIISDDDVLDLNENSWIFVRYEREDIEQQFAISTPNDTTRMDSRIKNAFMTTPSNIINWDQPYEFIGIDRIISPFISEISIYMGNITEIEPCHFYYFPFEKQQQFVPCPIPSEVELRSLNSTQGIEFLYKHGPIVNEKTKIYRTKIIERCPSIGTYINGKVVSGGLLDGSGHLGLVTNEKYKRKGLSNLCLQYLIKIILHDYQLIPCSIIFVKNIPSNDLHIKVGFQKINMCDFIINKG